jgi:hypothetical protein
MIGAAMDGRWSEALERRLLTLGLYMQYGLTKELLKTYGETSAESFIRRESQLIINQYDEVLGNDVPTFLLGEY